MEASRPAPHVDLVMRRNGAAPGQLAVAAIENLLAEHPGAITWEAVDALSRSGAKRYQELRQQAGKEIPVPAVLVDGRIAFDCMPKADDLTSLLAEIAGL